MQNWTKKFAKVAKVTKGCKMRCIFPDGHHTHHLLTQSCYIASSDFNLTVAWKSDGASHALVNVHQVFQALIKPNKVKEDAVMVIVGVVLPKCLNVTLYV